LGNSIDLGEARKEGYARSAPIRSKRSKPERASLYVLLANIPSKTDGREEELQKQMRIKSLYDQAGRHDSCVQYETGTISGSFTDQ